MAQKYFIYSFVARGPEILAEHAEKSGTFTGVASECLKKLPTTHTKFTYNWDGLTFNFLVEGPFTYCVVATDAAKRNLSNALLERVKDDFTKRYAGGKAANAYANSLSKEFGPKMKEHMQYFVSHPEEVDQLAKVKAQVAEVKETMIANIDKVVERGGNIEILIDKTEILRSQAKEFKQGGTQLKRKMWLNNMKIKLTVLGILIALFLIIFFSACGGLRCTK
ncbi:unnamed protein product [Rhodiola kirilowii]